MKTILFVDDEPNILAGLRRMFHGERDRWDMSFAEGALKAMSLIDANAYDIVVSDMRMPEMDGTELLTHVRDLHPASVRLILSGQTDRVAALRAASVAHQFLDKPVEAAVLKQAIVRASDLESRLSQVRLRSALGQHNSLPSPSATLRLLNDELVDVNCDLGRVAKIIEGDLSLAARILGLVNSAFFNLPKELFSVRDAVVYLGIANVRALAATTDIFRALGGNDELARLASRLQAHSEGVLTLAQLINPRSAAPADLYLGALLHDIGLLAIAALLPDAWRTLTTSNEGDWTPDDERALIGATHSEIGAYLLALWGLPYGAVEIVALHHDDLPIVSAASLSDIEAVRVADAVQCEADLPVGHNREHDQQYLESLGIDEQLDIWRRQRSSTSIA